MDVQKVRAKFPALSKEQVFFDNAGGSQVLGAVVDSYVQVLIYYYYYCYDIIIVMVLIITQSTVAVHEFIYSSS